MAIMTAMVAAGFTTRARGRSCVVGPLVVSWAVQPCNTCPRADGGSVVAPGGSPRGACAGNARCAR
eukprot:8660114-Lingulodinium_polyedra.AAC.1